MSTSRRAALPTPSAFTEGEARILLSVMSRLTGPIQTDWDLVATDCGLKDGKIAKVRYGQIKAKKFASTASPKKSVDTPQKIKAEPGTEAVDGATDDTNPTPTKKRRISKKAKDQDVVMGDEA